MNDSKNLPVIIGCLQLLALKEILRSPSFEPKDKDELKWLFDLIDKVATIDDVAHSIFGGLQNKNR